MNNTNTGLAGARAKAEELKAEQAAKEEETAIATQKGKENALATLGDDYMTKNANVGLSGLDAEDIPIPTLSVIQSTSKFKDEDNRPYAPGGFYYKALKQNFNTVECSILVINKKLMASYTDPEVPERTYMVLGVIMPTQMPFMMYAKKSSYFAVRAFIGEVKARKVPMFALRVELTTELRQNDQGSWYVPVFNIVGVVDNPETIVVLEELAKTYDESRNTLKSEEDIEQTKALGTDAVTGQEVPESDMPFS